MTKTVTFTPAALKQVLDAAIADALAGAGKAAKPAKAGSTPTATKVEGQLPMDLLVVRAFKKAGFGSVVPRQDVRTYGKWTEAGFKVKPGERCTKVRQFRLFHKSQVEAIGLPSAAEVWGGEEAQTEAATLEAEAAPAKPTVVTLKRRKASNPSQPSLGV